MHRSLASYVVVLAIGFALGLGAVAVARDNSHADASASQAQVVRELRAIKQHTRQINRDLDGYEFYTPIDNIADLLRKIDRDLSPTP